MNRKQIAVLIDTARLRITMATQVIAESRRRAAHGQGHTAPGIRVAVIVGRDRINVNEDNEVRDWAKKLGVSPDELKRAVQQVGDRADAVRQHFGK